MRGEKIPALKMTTLQQHPTNIYCVAEPGSTVSIYLGLKHLGEVIVAKDGTWSLHTLTTPPG